MHRFRKKSGFSRPGPAFDIFPASFEDQGQDFLPELPSESDFRTSLILPDLTRRFSVLRAANGDPIALDHLRARFAAQREQGLADQITEEEEDMLIDKLSRIRSKNAPSSTSSANERNADQNPSSDIEPERNSHASNTSNNTTTSAYPSSLSDSSRSTRSPKRYSNNLFSSGRLRDYNYLRGVTSQRSRGNSASGNSLTPTDSSNSLREKSSNYSDSTRPMTPESSGLVSSVPSSPNSNANEKTPVARSVSLLSSSEDSSLQPGFSDTSGSPQAFGQLNIRRTSIYAMERVIREIEEEAEDEILMPRTPQITPRHAFSSSETPGVADTDNPQMIMSPSSEVEAGTAMTSDKHMPVELEPHRLSPVSLGRSGAGSPSPRLPGYIPGMPRPMTPRDSTLDQDDLSRSHSTTPRATSPSIPSVNGQPPQLAMASFSSTLLRRGSDASRSTPRPTSPPTPLTATYLGRSLNGRVTPENARTNERSGGNETEDSPGFNSGTVRRRPVSPLTGSAFQSMSVSSRPNSRPATPSNITWNVPRSSPSPMHSRQGSETSQTSRANGVREDPAHGRGKSPSGLGRSAAALDSSVGHSSSGSISWNSSQSSTASGVRSPSRISGVDVNAANSSQRSARSPTPTQYQTPSSPSFPVFENSSNPGNGTPLYSQSHHKNSSSHFSNGLSGPGAFSPLTNSSRSSLESTGSSYHSSDGNKKGLNLELLLYNGTDQPAWHDLDRSNSAISDGNQDGSVGDFEEFIRRCAGLTKSDFAAIQEKLVHAALTKSSQPETRERSNSLRRRRPSTSQSNYSVSGGRDRVASPAPNQASPGSRSPAPDHNAKVNALLNSMVDSIHPSLKPSCAEADTDTPDETGSAQVSPTTRRNRDLARALGFSNDATEVQAPDEENAEEVSSPSSLEPRSPIAGTAIGGSSDVEDVASLRPRLEREPTETFTSFPQPMHRSASLTSGKVLQPGVRDSELVREVQRKADAAMVALNKSPSIRQKFDTVNASSVSVSRKRIDPSQISGPRFVSATASVDTVPLPPSGTSPVNPTNPQTSLSITQRIRRLRGTLRAKPSPNGEEITPFPVDLHPSVSPVTPTPTASANVYRRPTLPLSRPPPANGASDLGRSNTYASSPPASASPGIKGFMTRFRKTRGGESSDFGSPKMTPTHSPLPSTDSTHNLMRNSPVPSQFASPTPQPFEEHSEGSPSRSDDEAVKQLFEAGLHLGLKPADINNLLARSASVASKPAGSSLSRSQSTVRSPTPGFLDSNAPVEGSVSRERQSMDQGSSRGTPSSSRRVVIRTGGEGSGAQSDGAAVVRRTLIFPSEFRASRGDLAQVSRRPSQSGKRHRKTGSVISAQSARSVHDRAPTPPPPKAATGRRFSTDKSPPLPAMPGSISSQVETMLHAPPAQQVRTDMVRSAYDSLYDMYGSDSKHTSVAYDPNSDAPEGFGQQEGPALEVIEKANGETIWSIVNGLRDEDTESVYASRASFASEYSTRDNTEGVQVFVKGHGKSASKGSNSSFLSRKRLSQGKDRPDTKVYFSSSAQIGRLIENLSQGMDAGSFNFVPNLPADRATPSSLHSDPEMQWTVEEKLEHMLGAIRNS